MMKILTTIVAFFMISTNVFAEPFSGTYKTMPSKKTGGWAYVKFGACKENKNLTCGTLMKAFSKDGKAIKNYEHKNKYVEMYGSIFIPSRQFLARFKYRPWKGVYCSSKFLESLDFANDIVSQLLITYKYYNICPLIESNISKEYHFEQLKNILCL